MKFKRGAWIEIRNFASFHETQHVTFLYAQIIMLMVRNYVPFDVDLTSHKQQGVNTRSYLTREPNQTN